MDLLQKKHKQKCQRRLRTLFPGLDTSSINFSSTDYLNLASHPYVKEQGIAYSIKWGTGLLPTRSLLSYEEALKKTEERFAKFLGFETVTFYESDPYLFSQIPPLEERSFIIADSIDRKTGTIASLDNLRNKKENSNSLLAIDDSLSFSVLGNHGFGLAAEKEGIDLLFGSFSKCFGSYVSYFATSKQIKSHLFDKIASLHKEQYIPPLFLGMIDATIQLIPSMQAERKRLFALKQQLFTLLRKIGHKPPETKAPFISLSFSNPLEMKNLHLHLCEHSFIPSLSSSSLTLFPNISLTEKEIAQLFSSFDSYKELPLVEAL